MNDKDRLGADEIYRVFPFGRKAVEIAVARIRAEAVKAERERILSKGALSYIRELEHALCTMLPDGTSIDTVLMHPEKWRATYTDDKEAHRG